MDGRRYAALWPPFAICAVFFAFGIASISDFGLTLDEAESTRASREAWAVLSGSQSQFSEHHTIPGYYLALDFSREVFARIAALLSPGLDRVLAERIAVLEGSESAIVTGSGMAAISSVLFSLLSAGDHILVQDCLYGGTSGLVLMVPSHVRSPQVTSSPAARLEKSSSRSGAELSLHMASPSVFSAQTCERPAATST